MKNFMNSIQVQAPRRSTFDLSSTHKTTCEAGYLIPVYVKDVVPGDVFTMRFEHLARLLTPIAPMMHRVDVYFEAFFCPERIVWENFEKWVTNGGDDPQDIGVALPARPYFTYGGGGSDQTWTKGSLLDYMGLPNPADCPNPTDSEKVLAVPMGVYQKICDDWYRNENLIDKAIGKYTLVDGNNTATNDLFVLRKRAWGKDYFTACLPYAQKGDAVELPFNFGEAPVKYNQAAAPPNKLEVAHTATAGRTQPDNAAMAAGWGRMALEQADDPTMSDIYADLSALSGGAVVNDLRLSIVLQQYLETHARVGSRYAEMVRGFYNVKTKDYRFQRPEYIVGTKEAIQISEVLQTSETDGTPQGNPAGHGISAGTGNFGKYFCTEHGWIMVLMSIVPKTGYFQGIDKMWLKYDDPTQLLIPHFAGLGEQPVLNKEVMAFQGNDDNDAFGYMPMYSEYRTSLSRVSGEFRDTLKHWHMDREFDKTTPPVLNDVFVLADPTKRVFTVDSPGTHNYLVYINCKVHATRPIPFYGTPAGIML